MYCLRRHLSLSLLYFIGGSRRKKLCGLSAQTILYFPFNVFHSYDCYIRLWKRNNNASHTHSLLSHRMCTKNPDFHAFAASCRASLPHTYVSYNNKKYVHRRNERTMKKCSLNTSKLLRLSLYKGLNALTKTGTETQTPRDTSSASYSQSVIHTYPHT